MPTYDGGHCFLTVLLPISIHAVEEGGILSSPVHLVRERLSTLPTARQSPATLHANSPFARNDKTHFARFAIIDDLVFNGRIPTDAIFSKTNPTIPQKVDRLNCPYLMFVVDFDAPEGTESELRAYLREIWEQMKDELEPIFSHCHGFAKMPDAESFANYIKACQIETTMPFNDYWVGTPQLKSLSKSTIGLTFGLAIVVVWILLYLLCDRTGLLVEAGVADAGFWSWLRPWIRCAELALLPLLAFGIVGVAGYRLALWYGAKPFPAAPGGSLKSVLKALYLQRTFAGFAIKAQGLTDVELHTAFAAFVAKHRPGDLDDPTQRPGMVPLTEQPQ